MLRREVSRPAMLIKEHSARNRRTLKLGRHNMYCTACGKAMAEDDRVCSRCGKMVGIPPTPKKLIRSRAERKIAGVCAGLAQYFNLDVLLVRSLCVFIALATGVCPGV